MFQEPFGGSASVEAIHGARLGMADKGWEGARAGAGVDKRSEERERGRDGS